MCIYAHGHKLFTGSGSLNACCQEWCEHSFNNRAIRTQHFTTWNSHVHNWKLVKSKSHSNKEWHTWIWTVTPLSVTTIKATVLYVSKCRTKGGVRWDGGVVQSLYRKSTLMDLFLVPMVWNRHWTHWRLPAKRKVTMSAIVDLCGSRSYPSIFRFFQHQMIERVPRLACELYSPIFVNQRKQCTSFWFLWPPQLRQIEGVWSQASWYHSACLFVSCLWNSEVCWKFVWKKVDYSKVAGLPWKLREYVFDPAVNSTTSLLLSRNFLSSCALLMSAALWLVNCNTNPTKSA